MEASYILDALKDAAWARVVEAFLGSKASDKQKKKLISKYIFYPFFLLS